MKDLDLGRIGREMLKSELKQQLLKLYKEVLPVVLKKGGEALGGIVEDAKEEWSHFWTCLKHDEEAKPKNVVFQEVELLNYNLLKQLVREYRVMGANEAYVIKIQEGGYIYFQICYGVDKNPFDTNDNKFVVIKADAVSGDVLREFGESDVIILK